MQISSHSRFCGKEILGSRSSIIWSLLKTGTDILIDTADLEVLYSYKPGSVLFTLGTSFMHNAISMQKKLNVPGNRIQKKTLLLG